MTGLILKELKQTLKDQRVYRSELFELRKALCVDIRKSVKLRIYGWVENYG